MSNKKFELKKFNNYFTLTVILFVVFLIYIVEIVYFQNKELTKIEVQLIVDMWFTQKEYNSIGNLLISLGWMLILSYLFGFIIAGYGWYTERKKRIKAEGTANGLKGKLSKVENERDFYKKKYEILEKGINSSAPPADKKPAGKGKPKSKKTSMIVLLVALIVGGAVVYKLFYVKEAESQIVQVKIGIPENSNNPNAQE